jgi:hypothetical protein
LPWRAAFGRVASFDEARWTRTPPAKTEQGVGCNPAERVSPRRFAEPHPHRSQVMCRGRLHPHRRWQKMKDHCNQCGTDWDVPDSINWEDSQWDPCGELPIKQLQLLRDRYGASEYDAKSIAGHIPWSGGRCHNCSRRIPRGWVSCDGCGATNYNFHGPLTIAQRLYLRPNPLLKPNQPNKPAHPTAGNAPV